MGILYRQACGGGIMNWLINWGVSIATYFVTASFYQSFSEMVETIDFGGCVFIVTAGAVVSTTSQIITACIKNTFAKQSESQGRILFLSISIVITLSLTIAMVYKLNLILTGT